MAMFVVKSIYIQKYLSGYGSINGRRYQLLLSDQTRQPAPTALTSNFAIFSSRRLINIINK